MFEMTSIWRVLGLNGPDDYPSWMRANMTKPGEVKITRGPDREAEVPIHQGAVTRKGKPVAKQEEAQKTLKRWPGGGRIVLVRCNACPITEKQERRIVGSCDALIWRSDLPCPRCSADEVRYLEVVPKKCAQKLRKAAEIMGCPSSIYELEKRLGETVDWYYADIYARVEVMWDLYAWWLQEDAD